MRKNHAIGGLIVFCVGLFLLYLYSPFAVELFKGVMQPALIVIGLAALAGAVLWDKKFRKINLAAGVVFLGLGIYGLYDEYYAVMDFFTGMLPPVLVIAGLIAIFHGIKKLT